MRFLVFNVLILIVIFACRRDNISPGEGTLLSFSAPNDTLMFDTVFTTVGSATRYFKVYNNDNHDININSISLNQGESSSFRLNIDGEANHTVENTLLRSGDSIYIFAEVTINPNDLSNSFAESDAIMFNYGTKSQKVDLIAWGRNANFYSGVPDYQQYPPQSNNLDSMLYSDFFNSILLPEELIGKYFYYYAIKENTIWTNTKPHVVYGDIIIENGATLTIQAGSEIYLHNNAWLIVDSLSSLHSLGNASENELIWFQSDRSDSHSLTDYANTPGQWGKIWIMSGSVNNKMEYTILKNGKIGIQVDGVNDMNNLPDIPILELKNSIIYNMSAIGLFGQGSNINAENLLMFNCGQHLLVLNIGGSYDFKHCTFANFWPFARQTPSIFINNYYEDINEEIQSRDLLNASFGNCIIDGNNENEIVFDKGTSITS